MNEQLVKCSHCGELVPQEEVETVYGDDYCRSCGEELFIMCTECEELFYADDIVFCGGEGYCYDCIDNVATQCAQCGEYVLDDDAHYFPDSDSETYCEDCFNYLAVKCDNCGDSVHCDSVNEDSYGMVLCDHCLNNYFYMCVECDRFVHEHDICEFDDGIYCRDCYDRRNRVIHSYNYKPDPIFYGKNDPLYMGIEIEIDGGGYDHDNAAEIMEPLGDLVYAKYDSSLDWKNSDVSGFEMVTHPMTLDYFYTQEGSFRGSFKIALSMDYRSHDAGTCGIHIHISRRYFEGELAVEKLIYLFERFWPEIKKFSRRTAGQIREWAQRYCDDRELENCTSKDENDLHEKVGVLLSVAKDRAGKYRAVNIMNYSTIELRIFRGSLKYSTFAATVEFAHMIATISKECSVCDVHSLTWQQIVDRAQDYRYLPSYLKERSLA